MRNPWIRLTLSAMLCAPLAWFPAGCGQSKSDPKAEAPPATSVEQEADANNFKVDHPEQFPLATAAEHKAARSLNVTGVVQPDIARAVPVVSLASGRVVEIKARLGDTVKKGQVLLRVQSGDVSGAYQTFSKAVNDERLARLQLERAKTLYEKGAIAKSLLEQAENTAQDAKADLDAAEAQLKLLGVDREHPGAVVDIVAPVSGVITDQQVTNAAGVTGLGSPSPFTISDLSIVWIVCDVYEDDLASVHVGQTAEIRLNAYPDKVLKGTINNVSSVMDPTLRTAKVRVEVGNPGLMRVGMFVTAAFHGQTEETHASVPATAILHLHDRDWVYIPAGGKNFRRVEVTSGGALPNNMQEIASGIKPGQQVVSNALVLQNTVEQ